MSNELHSSQLHWPSVAQLGFGLLSAATLFSLAGLLGLTGFLQFFLSPDKRIEVLPSFLLSAGLAAAGVLMLPSALFALARLGGFNIPTIAWLARARAPRLMLIWPLVLLLGHWVSQISILAWLLLPPLHVLAVCLPVLWLLYLTNRDLPAGSAQRRWGVFAIGTTLAPALILVAEMLMLGSVVALVATVLANRPVLAAELEDLVNSLQNGPPSPELVMHLFGPYLARPSVLFGLLAFGAVLVPLVEEALKPIGVWLLAGKGLSPVEGFSAGALSGAGYALIESLMLSAQAESWAGLVFARLGTDLIHILTAGLTGCALALAWRDGRYLRLAAAYLCAVIVHGLWNGLTLFNLAGSLAEEYNPGVYPDFFLQLARLAPINLVILALVGFVAIIGFNTRMRRISPSGDSIPSA